jgi:hypothetical protein
MTSMRGALRPLRTEIRAVLALTLLVALMAGGVALRLLAFGIPENCISMTVFDAACVSREVEINSYIEFASSWGGAVAYAAVLLPSFAGVIFGVGVVGKELDQRTAVLAWSLSWSRRRWLIQRLVPLAVIVVLLGLGATFLFQVMISLRGGGPLPLMFESIPIVGLGPAVEGLGALGISLAVGAMLGRLLPALLASAAFVVFSFVLVTQVNDRLLHGESIVVDQATLGPESYALGRYLDSFVQTADGQILSWDQVYPDYADPETGELLPGVTQLLRIAPIEILPEVAARFLLFHLLIAATALTLGLAVTDRRTP